MYFHPGLQHYNAGGVSRSLSPPLAEHCVPSDQRGTGTLPHRYGTRLIRGTGPTEREPPPESPRIHWGKLRSQRRLRVTRTNNTSLDQFSICLAINICSREMAARHRMGPSDYPTFPHACNLQGCLGVHIGPLTEAYQTLSGAALPAQGSSK